MFVAGVSPLQCSELLVNHNFCHHIDVGREDSELHTGLNDTITHARDGVGRLRQGHQLPRGDHHTHATALDRETHHKSQHQTDGDPNKVTQGLPLPHTLNVPPN